MKYLIVMTPQSGNIQTAQRRTYDAARERAIEMLESQRPGAVASISVVDGDRPIVELGKFTKVAEGRQS